MTRQEFIEDAPDEKFAAWIWDSLKDVEPLKERDLPYIWYCETGDILHVTTDIRKLNSYYSKWVDHVLTLEYSFDGDIPVGFELWGFKTLTGSEAEEFLDSIASMGICVSDDLRRKIRLQLAEVRRINRERNNEHEQGERVDEPEDKPSDQDKQ